MLSFWPGIWYNDLIPDRKRPDGHTAMSCLTVYCVPVLLMLFRGDGVLEYRGNVRDGLVQYRGEISLKHMGLNIAIYCNDGKKLLDRACFYAEQGEIKCVR